MGFCGFDRNPLLNLAVFIIVLWQFDTANNCISVACMQLYLTDTIYSYNTLSNTSLFTSHCIQNDRDTLIEQSGNYSNRAIKATA